MSKQTIGALVLAAGKGTRMCSDRPKVLHEILGEPMLRYVLDAAEQAGLSALTVIGHGAEMVREAFPECNSSFVLQEQQLGTGHALQCAWADVKARGFERVLVVNGDTPLVSADRIASLAQASAQADVAFLTVSLDDPGSFGRVVRNDDGTVAAIVEARDFDPKVHGEVNGEINAGIYSLKVEAVEPLLDLLSDNNASGEFYITDLVGLAVERGMRVEAVEGGRDMTLLGVNCPSELVDAEELLRDRIVRSFLDSGVIVRHPAQAVIGPRVSIEGGCEIVAPVQMVGSTTIGRGAVVGPNCWIKDSTVAAGAEIRPFSHLEQAEVGPECQIGPYARLRPGAVTEQGARVGNFVEMKKARLREGAKANHLTYLGDADVGPGANIGAGTITCNYDGVNKHQTVIGEQAFIGSNTALVAPVTVGRNALVGAGSVITKNVEDDNVALTRAKQKAFTRRK